MGGSRGETASGNPREQYYHLVPKRIAIVKFSSNGRVFPYNFRIEGFTRYGTTVRTSTFGFWGSGGGALGSAVGITVTLGRLAARMYHYTRIGSNEYRNGNTQSEFFYEGSAAIRKGSLLRDSQANCSYDSDIGKTKILIRREPRRGVRSVWAFFNLPDGQ